MRKRGGREPRESRIASGWTVEADPADLAPEATTDQRVPDAVELDDAARVSVPVSTSTRPQLGSGMLVLLGVIGGLYLLYTAVWFSWAKYYSDMNAALAQGSGVVGAIVQQTVFWAAPFAPVLWFLSALFLNRGSRPRALVLWLLLGALVLVPLPVFNFGAGA